MPDNPEQAVRRGVTGKGYLVLLLSLTMSLAGISLASTFITVVGLTALLYTASSYVRTISVRGELEREVSPAELFEGGRVRVTLRGMLKAPGAKVTLQDEVPPTAYVKGGARWRLPAGGVVRKVGYRAKMKLRGMYRLGPLKAISQDPGGHFSLVRELGGESHVTVLPRPVPAGVLPHLKAPPRLLPGFSHSRSVGQGKEFHSIREYYPEDPFKIINWHATARRRRLMVNQYEAESLTDVVIIIDAREWTGRGDLYRNPLEDSVRVAASLIRLLLSARNRVGLVLIGEGVKYIRPAAGERHFRSLLHELASVSPRGGVPLKEALKVAAQHLSPSSPLVLFTPLTEGMDAREGLEFLLSLGHPLIVISPDPAERARYAGGHSTPREVLTGIERRALASLLLKGGARFFDMKMGHTVKEVLEGVMG